jgi:hypothetical protein
MKLDPRVVAIAKQFEPGLPLANWTDDNRRAWLIQVIEQVVFRFPDGGWGAKRSGPRRPLSRDAIALKRDGHVWAFGLVSGSTKRVKNNVEGVLIDDQVFVPVAGRDHLGMLTPGAGADDAPPSARADEPTGDAAVVESLPDIAATLADLTARLARVEEASSASRSDLDALKRTVEQIAAAVSPGTTATRGRVPGT